MRIGIIGTGELGSALAERFSERHEVLLGSRTPNGAQAKRLAGRSVRIGRIIDVLNESEIIFLAVPAHAVEHTCRMIADLSDQILVDCTNLIEQTATDESSTTKIVTNTLGDRNVVKAFNTMGAHIIKDPTGYGTRLDMLFCGDPAGKEKVSSLIEEIGFRPVDVGQLERGADLEALARLWIELAYRQGDDPNLSFTIAKRQNRDRQTRSPSHTARFYAR